MLHLINLGKCSKYNYSREVAGFVLASVRGPAAVAAARAGHVELSEALWVGARGLPAPDERALLVPRRAVAIEAVAQALVARLAVLEEDVGRALRREAVAHFGQVTLVLGLAADEAGWKELAGKTHCSSVQRK